MQREKKVSRRDFLKLAGLLPISIAAPKLASSFDAVGRLQSNKQNVLVIVFDAWSASHLSQYGYQRETTPHLTKLAEKAVVYHNHYAGGNYTTPGTASLLTGTYPWTHRAFQPGGRIPEILVPENIFSHFEDYHRVTYSHNLWANLLLRQFKGDLDYYISKSKYFLGGDQEDPEQGMFLNSDTFIPTLFGNDEDIALVSWLRALERNEEGYAYSLFLSPLYEQYRKNFQKKQFADLLEFYPRGIPKDDYDYFLLEYAIDSIGELLTVTPQPFMGYFHFWPPHAPYNSHKDFVGRFNNDGYTPPQKSLDLFGDTGPKTKNRTEYDEYILYVDREFGRFYDHLEQNGILENTWIVLTSDHGEMFERGIEGHRTPVLYDPVVHVPLMIFEPGRSSRVDVFENTSAVDILPTVLHVTEQRPASWTEGTILPPYAPVKATDDRSVYVVQADKNEQLRPLTVTTIALRKGNYKLTYFVGYDELEGTERIELHNIAEDPEELNNLYEIEKEIGKQLLSEIKAKLNMVNAPFRTN